MNELSACFGVAVRQLRTERRWTQLELAGRSNLDRSYVGEIERGEVVVSIVTAEKIARAMDVDLPQLFLRCRQSETRTPADATRVLPIAR
jgi:transcriptional regulator with XRE-family HTH domain